MKNFSNRRFARSTLIFPAAIGLIGMFSLACDPKPKPPPILEKTADDADTLAEGEGPGVEVLTPLGDHGHLHDLAEVILDTRDQIDTSTSTSTAVWTVDGVVITEESVDLVRQMQTEQIKAQVPEEFQASVLEDLEANIRETMISLELLAREARAAKLDQDESTQALMDFSRLEILANAFFDDQIEANLAAEDIDAWYKKHLVQFQQTHVDLRMLSVADETLANSLKTQIEAGADFEALAREHGTDPSAESGGDFLGENGPANLSELAPPIQEKLSPLSDGGTTDAFETMPGTFALLHLKTRTESVQPLEEVRDEIEARIRQEAASTLLHAVRDLGSIVPGEDGPPEGVASPAEGQTVVFWINEEAFDEALITAILGPQIRAEEQRYQQQIMMQAQQLPQDAQMAFAQQKMDEFQRQQGPAMQQQLIESLVHQILLSHQAEEMGYGADREVILEQQNREREILANLYFRDQADALAAAGGSPSPETMHTLVEELWAKSTILDLEGQPIPPPERKEVPGHP